MLNEMDSQGIRKSSRARKKSHFRDNDYQYEVTKTTLDVDVSKDISNILSFHSSENEACRSIEPLKIKGKKKALKKQLSCSLCNKTFPSITSLKRHVKSHSLYRPYQCELCAKSFIDSGNLKRHMKIHEDERPFSCSICSKAFRDSASFGRHQLTHTERPRSFQCSVCQKAFIDNNALKRHERTHSGLRPYECDVCHKTFSESGSFRRHLKIHFGSKNFHCPRCKRRFLEKQSLIRHQKVVCGFWKEADLSSDSSMNGSSNFNQNVTDTSTSSFVSTNGMAIFPSPSTFPNSSPSKSSCSIKRNSSRFSPKKRLSTKSNKIPLNASPSLGSLIQKDPNLYDSISEIVESIDSYEKMLDLCGDGGQKEIEAALTRESSSTTSHGMCFECGEPLVDGENFIGDGKPYPRGTGISFRCLHCEKDVKKCSDVNQSEDHLNFKNDVESSGNENVSETLIYKTTDSSVYYSQHQNRTHLEVQSNENHNSFPHSFNNGQWNHQVSQNSYIPVASYPVPDRESSEMNTGPWNSNSKTEINDEHIPTVFPCHLCTKVFSSPSFLEQHLELHKKSPFKCMVCGKYFKGNPALKRHMLIHTGEKPYSCPFCQKKIRDLSNFGKHKRYCAEKMNLAGTGMDTSMQDQSNVMNSDVSANFGEMPVVKTKENMSIHLAYDAPSNFNGTTLPNKENESVKPIMVLSAPIDDLDDQLYNDNDSEAIVHREQNKINYIPCDICQKLCEGEQHLEMHMNYHNGNPEVTCIECGKSFSDRHSLKRHMRIHSDTRPFTCEYCQCSYCDNWGLKKHRIKGCHLTQLLVPADFLYPCSKCHRVFSDASFLGDHMTSSHRDKKKFECEICQKRFTDASKMEGHRRLHFSVCHLCDQEFASVDELEIHLIECLPSKAEVVASPPKATKKNCSDKRFHCSECDGSYSSLAYLERHQRIHTNVRLHECDICSKKFMEAFQLRRHKQAHTNAKPHVCQDCGRGFADEARLKRHIINSSCTICKIMRGAINFPCQVCDKVFNKNYMLVRHMNVHSQERPFACDICGRSYKDTSSLKRHQLIHEGNKDFICSTCGKEFFYADSLKRHKSGRCGKTSKPRKKKNSSGSAKGKSKRKRGRPPKRLSNNYKPVDSHVDDDKHSGLLLSNINASKDNEIEISIVSNSNEKGKLYTLPYEVKTLSHCANYFRRHVKGGSTKGESWSCRNKAHCWRCDSKFPSRDVLLLHISVHHRKNKATCRKCFAKFRQKLYWKAHLSLCMDHSDYNLPSAAKSASNPVKVESSPNDIDLNPINGGRSRRSIPRVRWSWLTEI